MDYWESSVGHAKFEMATKNPLTERFLEVKEWSNLELKH